MAPSLLDLPELALHEIAKHLRQHDLASCMQTCSALNALFRPQQSALVCTRHFGKKWVLRACGRALFRAVAECWEAGEMRLNSAGRRFEVQHAEEQRVLARKAAQNDLAVRRAWAHWKANGILQPDSIEYIDDLAYFCNLAESKGFRTVVNLLDTRGSKFFSDKYYTLEYYREQRANLNSRPDFFEDSLWEDVSEKLQHPGFISLELISGLWLVSFLVSLDCSTYTKLKKEEELESVLGNSGS